MNGFKWIAFTQNDDDFRGGTVFPDWTRTTHPLAVKSSGHRCPQQIDRTEATRSILMHKRWSAVSWRLRPADGLQIKRRWKNLMIVHSIELVDQKMPRTHQFRLLEELMIRESSCWRYIRPRVHRLGYLNVYVAFSPLSLRIIVWAFHIVSLTTKL